jgi:hypothetical protein
MSAFHRIAEVARASREVRKVPKPEGKYSITFSKKATNDKAGRLPELGVVAGR